MKAWEEAIRIQNSISVVTSFGEHVVELCYGDITKLPVEEKMDIVMVSAFIGRSIPNITLGRVCQSIRAICTVL